MLTERFPRLQSGTPAVNPRTTDIVKTNCRFVWALTAGLAAASVCWGSHNPNPAKTPAAENRQTIAVTVAKAHEWEMQAELDLLADPLTFPYSLQAHISTEGLEIRGRVPNVWIRDHALKMAKNVCEVAIVDGMIVDAKMPMPLPHMQSATFASDARQRLERAAVKLTGPVEILAPGNGQITLSGKIGSAEDKMQMSRALRGMPGCTCVKNELVVNGAVKQAVHVQETAKAREPAKVAQVEHTAPAEASTTNQSMPASPVTPIRGTLRKESNLTGGAAAKLKLDDEKQPSRVVQVSSPTEKGAKQDAPAKPVATTPKGLPSPEVQAAIQKRLKSGLGRSAREIVMQFDNNGGAKIQVKVAKISDVEKVYAVVQQLPELAPYDVNIEFLVGQ